MKKQKKMEPGRKLTVLRTSEFLRVLGGQGSPSLDGGTSTPVPGGFLATPMPPR